MQNNLLFTKCFKFLKITIFIIALLLTSSYQVDPSFCTNYYSNLTLPQQCNNTTKICYFLQGIQALVSNQTQVQPFVLCLDLSGYSIYINFTNTTDNYVQVINSVYIYSSSVIMSEYSLLCDQNLIIYGQNQVNITQTSLTGSKIFILSEHYLYISGGSNLKNQGVVQSQCSCSMQKKQCNWTFAYPNLFQLNQTFNISQYFTNNTLNFSFTPNNSVSLVALEYIEIDQTIITYSIIGVFSQNILINNSTLSTSGLGFPSDSGPGCGYFDQVLNQLLGCLGSGGSHGGFGGNSSPQNCYLLVSRQPYDSIYFPTQPGSGGGFFLPRSRQSSSGGGVINIQAQNLSLIEASVTSQGKNGIQGGGGGAGGTISIDYDNIAGYKSIISANGGNGDKVSSSGAGGRIRLWNHSWKNQNLTNVDITVTAYGGLGCKVSEFNASIQLSCGENGSVFTSPCRPGTALQLNQSTYICTPCPSGSYQLSYGYSRCIPCTAKPNNSNWSTTQVNINQSYIYQNTCSYECFQPLMKYKGNCVTSTQMFLQQIYATNIFISLGMIGAAIGIYFLILLIKKLGQHQNILSFDDPTLNEAYRKKFFRLEDLPYHQVRLYLSGQNHPFKPWKISQQAEQNLFRQIKNPVTKINHIIAKVIKQINKKAEYSRWQKILIRGLRYTYYPLSRIALSSLRKTKAKMLFEQVDNYNKKIPKSDLLSIKFHVKPQQTVASLEIFNQSKSVFDFYIQNYFPLYILLEKAPFGGYIIDFSDPFLKVFINQIIQKQSTGKSIQNFLTQINILLKNPNRMTSCLNHLWTLSQINSKFQAYLWQPTIKTLGIDRYYKADKKQPLYLIFSSQNLNNNHFLQKQSLPTCFLPEIQCLKHKFIIRKDLANQEDGNSICLINSNFKEKGLIWIFGILTTIFLILAISSLFLNAFVLGNFDKCDNITDSFNYGFIIYFALWPLCDFSAAFLNYKTMISKSQYDLADSISFNIFTVIKSTILFVCLLVKFPNFGKGCLQANQFIWLSMIIIGIFIYIVQIMLRPKIIQQAI